MTYVMSQEMMFKRLRKVLLKGRPEHPYRFSEMSVEQLNPEYLVPCQRYVIQENLTNIEQLRYRVLEDSEKDIFNLSSVVVHDGIEILPPVVEEQIIHGRIMPLICDGLHRTYLALQQGYLIKVIYIRPLSFLYYAHPVRGGWQGVEMIKKEDLDESYIKKFHVQKKYQELFRDFTTQFNNLSKPRERYGSDK